MAAFDEKTIAKLLGSVKGVGTDTKSQKEMAKLQAKLQQQLQEQQNQYNQQLQAQAQAASLQQQREQEAWQSPFSAAQLTGSYNGQQTLASKQADEEKRQYDLTTAESKRQFGVTSDQDQQKIDLQKDISNRQLALDSLTQQQKNAIDQGNLDLARQIQTEQVRLQGEQQAAQIKLQTADQSGFLDNGSLTEAARAEREKEALAQRQAMLSQTQAMGVDAQGHLTDASQQWRTNAGLQAAQTNAQLGQQSSDYFEAAAYNRDPNVQAALAFNKAAGMGSSVGFRSAANDVPGTNSIDQLSGTAMLPANQQNVPGQTMSVDGSPAMGMDNGPSPSLSAAQGALAGNPATFDSAMHTEQANMPQQPPSAAPQQAQVMGSANIYNANATGQPDLAQQRLAQIQRQIIRPGAAKLAPGTMEGWSPTEKGLIQSGLKASGVNPADFEQQYQRSRLQTGVSALAA